MPPQTVTQALAEVLADLDHKEFRKFCKRLVDRREEPRVVRSRVDGKDELDVTDVLVSTFTEDGALQVTLDLLRNMECNQQAQRLAEMVAAFSALGSSSASPSAAVAAGGTVMSLPDKQHFVDRNMMVLIKRVKNINPILDGLLEQEVLQAEQYSHLHKKVENSTKENAMRELLSGPLTAGGNAAKDIFCQLLRECDKFLMDELEGGQ